MRRTDRDPFPSSPRRPGLRRRVTLAAALGAILAGLLAMSLALASPALATARKEPARAQQSQAQQSQARQSQAQTPRLQPPASPAPGTVDARLQPAQASEEPSADPGVFDVLQVNGVLDGIVADSIERALDRAAASGSKGLVLQVDSTHAVISDERLVELAEAIAGSDVPVYAWVGAKASAERRVAQLIAVTEELAVSVGSRFGNVGDLVVPESLLMPAFVAAAPELADSTVNDQEALDLGLAGRDSPTLAFFVLGLPGFESEVVEGDDGAERRPLSTIRFSKLSLLDGWLHSFASPAMAYLLFLIGGGLLIFELYTAGVGIAGVLGAGSFVLACFGLAGLPTRGWALALLVVAMLGYAIDVQTGIPRLWSAIATVCLVIGSLWLYSGLAISWITLAAGIVGLALSMTSGMPSMIRSRFGTPTIGREWMIGAIARAADDIAKEGVVIVGGAPWKARVNRTTPIRKDDPVRVVAIEGLYLEIEPEEGGARDYREMGRRK